MSKWLLSFTGYILAAIVLLFIGPALSAKAMLGFGLAVLFCTLVSTFLMRVRSLSRSVMQSGIELFISSIAIVMISPILGSSVGLPAVAGWILGMICARASFDQLRWRALLVFVLFWVPALFWLDGDRRVFVASMLVASGGGIFTPWLASFPQWAVLDSRFAKLLSRKEDVPNGS